MLFPKILLLAMLLAPPSEGVSFILTPRAIISKQTIPISLHLDTLFLLSCRQIFPMARSAALLGYPTSFSFNYKTEFIINPPLPSYWLLLQCSPSTQQTRQGPWKDCQLLSLPHLSYLIRQAAIATNSMLHLQHSSGLPIFYSYHFRLSVFPAWFITNSFSSSPCHLSSNLSKRRELLLKLKLTTINLLVLKPFTVHFKNSPDCHLKPSMTYSSTKLSHPISRSPSYISFMYIYSEVLE